MKFKLQKGNLPLVEWPDKMLASYLSINSHAPPSPTACAELLSRLQPSGYLHTVFGPTGLNKFECDFLKLFEFNGDLTTRSISKTGDVLRWDVDGTGYIQNDWPIHMYDPLEPNVVTLTTTDGWSGIGSFSMSNNNLTGEMPYFGDLDAMAYFHCDNNPAMVGVIPSFAGCIALRVFGAYVCQFTGTLPSFLACTGLLNFNIDQNNFSGETPPFHACSLIHFYLKYNLFTTHVLDLSQVSRVRLDVRCNSFDETSIDNYLLDYEAIKTPMALSGNDYSILLQNNIPPSAIGLVAKQAIINEFLATPGSGTLVITHD